MGNATNQASNTLLQLLGVVGAVGFRQFLFELTDSLRHISIARGLPGNNRGGVLGDDNLFRRAQHIDGDVIQSQSASFGHKLRLGHNGNILQHRHPSLTETRGFHGRHFDGTAHLVHHQGGKGFPFQILGNQQQRLTGLGRAFQNPQNLLEGADFCIGHQHKSVFQNSLRALLIGHEIGRNIAAIKLHSLDNIHRGGLGFRLFNGNHAILGDLTERVRN